MGFPARGVGVVLQVGDVLVGTPFLNPQYNWYDANINTPMNDSEIFFNPLMELPVGYQEIIKNVPHGEIKLHGDLIDLCLAKTCLLIKETSIFVNEEYLTIFEILCNTMTSENTFEWRKLWVKKSILQLVLDNYPQYLKKL
jgi:hypothetical protein